MLGAVSCSAAAASKTAARADDGKDDLAVLQADIDRLSAAGGGVLQLEAGTYDLSMPLYLRSGVQVRGRGDATILSNKRLSQRYGWFGTTVFAGNLTPASYSDEDGRGYPGKPVRRLSSTEVEIAKCDPAKVGGLGNRVVWLSSSEYIRGSRSRVINPVWGEMNLVARASGCRVTLTDPIQIPSGENLQIHWSDGSRALPGGHEPNAPIRAAGLDSLQLESNQGQAMVATGCYRCTFTNLRIGQSRRLLMVQGMRHTVYRNISGMFTEKGIEITKYATDNVVEKIDGQHRPTADATLRPALRVAEYARRNQVRDVQMRLGAAYEGKTKIRFDASSDTKVERVKLFLDRQDRSPGLLYVPPEGARGPGGRLPPGTTLNDVQLCVGGSCVAVD
jgi:hypothetical protein